MSTTSLMEAVDRYTLWIDGQINIELILMFAESLHDSLTIELLIVGNVKEKCRCDGRV